MKWSNAQTKWVFSHVEATFKFLEKNIGKKIPPSQFNYL